MKRAGMALATALAAGVLASGAWGFSGMGQRSGERTLKDAHGKGNAPAFAETIKVGKAGGENAYTVAEVHERRSELDRKPVVVRGKVVKVSMGIMGKNWVHLRDGSGDKDKGTNNLVATTLDEPKVGDEVTVRGTAYKDKDFGSGYTYSVIVEEATAKP